MSGTAAELVPGAGDRRPRDRRRRARAGHPRAPARVRRRAARPRRRATRTGSTSSRSARRARRPRRLDPSGMTQIELYDTTLRDGMQGEGMSLSAQEKLRVAHRLDELGIDLIEAGFPELEPQGARAVRAARRRALRARLDRRVRDDPPAGHARRRTIPALRVLADCFAPVCTLVGKTWGLHLEKVVKVDREENLRMIAESVAFLVGAGQAGRLRRRALLRRVRRRSASTRSRCLRAAAEAGAETVVCCDTNGGTLPDAIAAAMGAVVARARRRAASRSGSTATTTPAAAWPTRSPPSQAGRDPRAGDDQRLRRAVRQRQPDLDHPQPPAQARATSASTEAQLASLTPTAHYVDELLNFTPDPDQPYVGPQRVRAQGRDARRRRRRRPGDVRARRPRGRRQPPRGADLRAVGQGHRHVARARRRDRARRRGRRAASSSGSRSSSIAAITSRPPTARSSCCCARRPASTSRCSGSSPGARSSRSAPTAGSRPRRRSRSGSTASATCAPPRATARSTRSTGRCATRWSRSIPTWATSTSSTSRSGSSTRRRAPARSPACCSTPPTATDVWGSIGVSENVIEASWEALVDSLEYGMQSARGPRAPASASAPGT